MAGRMESVDLTVTSYASPIAAAMRATKNVSFGIIIEGMDRSYREFPLNQVTVPDVSCTKGGYSYE